MMTHGKNIDATDLDVRIGPYSEWAMYYVDDNIEPYVYLHVLFQYNSYLICTKLLHHCVYVFVCITSNTVLLVSQMEGFVPLIIH